MNIIYLSNVQKDTSVYEAYFIPNGNAGVDENVNNEINLKYKMFAKARALGNIAKKIDSNVNLNSSEFLKNLYDSHNVDSSYIAEQSKKEYGANYIKKYFKDYKQANTYINPDDPNDGIYIAEEVSSG